jgi:hypothetical protein
MSLLIWLPLTKDLRTYGVQHSEVTATGATYNANGKLGGCYSFNDSAYLMGTHNCITNDIGDWSFACWMKLNATTSGQTLFSCRTSASEKGITVFYYGSQWFIDDGIRWALTPTTTIAKDIWYHLCVVRKKGVGKYLYINGILDKSTTTTGTPTIINSSLYSIGLCQNSATTVSGNPLNGYLNDIRFYDHALSVAEIKDISKGLCLHYKLDDFYGADNLIVNGYGELGTENWNNTSTSYISTTEIPSDHTEIKASFYNGNSTKEYIPITTSHLYTVSGYIKAMSGRTGSTYPSIFPYDIDKKFINYFNTRDGFNNNAYMTTLSQPLHKGDTVIHATDLSAWTTGDNYFFHVAIFGYKNSLGQVYPDMTYTQDAPSFGTRTDKSNIDKTNNTITLKAAFTGEDRPAGTVICQSTEGSTYYYPWGGINYSTIQDWTFKTATFKPMNYNRLKYAAYIRWSTYGGTYIAGNRIVDNTLTTTEVVDSSGHGNHGTKSGNISVSYNSPRYEISTVFDSGSHIHTPALSTAGIANSYTFSWWAKFTNHSSHMMWGFSNGNRLNLYMASKFCWNTGDGTSNSFNISTSTYADDNWHHFVVTGDGSVTKLYIDGLFKANASAYKGVTGTTIYLNGWDSGANYNFNGQLSDFRIYATALSAEDILALYNVGARVFKNGMMAGYELKEVH